MRHTLTAAERPERITLDVGGQELVFVRVTGDHYAAEWDGNRLPIWTTRQECDVGSRLWEPILRVGETANIDALLYGLSLEPSIRSTTPQSVVLNASDNWGHYRQWTYVTITVTITSSSVVDIHERIDEQDDSYY